MPRKAEIEGVVKPGVDNRSLDQTERTIQDSLQNATDKMFDARQIRRTLEQAVPGGQIAGGIVDRIRGGGTRGGGGGGGSAGGNTVQLAQLETLNDIQDTLEKMAVTGASGGGGGGGLLGGGLLARAAIGGGTLATAGAVGGGILGGLGLGLGATNVLSNSGALGDVQAAGKGTQDVLGQQASRTGLKALNFASGGRFEALAKAGAAIEGTSTGKNQQAAEEIQQLDNIFGQSTLSEQLDSTLNSEPSWLSDLQEPGISEPQWVSDLANIQFETPAWVNSLLSTLGAQGANGQTGSQTTTQSASDAPVSGLNRARLAELRGPTGNSQTGGNGQGGPGGSVSIDQITLGAEQFDKEFRNIQDGIKSFEKELKNLTPDDVKIQFGFTR